MFCHVKIRAHIILLNELSKGKNANIFIRETSFCHRYPFFQLLNKVLYVTKGSSLSNFSTAHVSASKGGVCAET
jgi:hypothetical protein